MYMTRSHMVTMNICIFIYILPGSYDIVYECLKDFEKHIDNKGTYGDFDWTLYNRMVTANGGLTPQLDGNFQSEAH